MKKSKQKQYFHCFIDCILDLYAFWFGYQQNIVTIPIGSGFRGVTLIRGEALIRGRCLSQWNYSQMRLNQRATLILDPALIRRNTVSILHNFIQQSLNSDSAQVQVLFAACERLEMVRISGNGPSQNKAKRYSSVNHNT